MELTIFWFCFLTVIVAFALLLLYPPFPAKRAVKTYVLAVASLICNLAWPFESVVLVYVFPFNLNVRVWPDKAFPFESFKIAVMYAPEFGYVFIFEMLILVERLSIGICESEILKVA